MIGNALFDEMSVLKKGLEISWTEYLTMMNNRAKLVSKLERENKELSERIKIMEAKKL